MADNNPTPDFSGLRYIPIDMNSLDWDASKNTPNPKDIVSSEPLQLKPSTNKTLPSAVQPLPTPKDIYNTTVEGGKQFIQGTQELGQGPSSGSGTAEAIHDVISGGMKAGTVPMMFAAAVDPMLTLEGAAESKVGQDVVEKGSSALGASPETAQMLGDIASVLVPTGIHMLPERPEGGILAPFKANREAGQIDFSGLRVVPENNIIYRARPEGQEGIKVTEGSHAHATANEAEAHQYAENLNKMAEDKGENTKHVVDAIDLNKVPYGDYDVMKGPNGHDWIKFKTDQPEDIFKKTEKPAEEKSNIKLSTDNNGIKWAENADGIKVSIPKRIADADVDSYAREQLDSQAKGQAAMKDKITKEKGEDNQKSLVDAMNKFNKSEGRSNINPDHVSEPNNASQIADAYKASSHAPNDPAVKKSYDALKADIDKQYDLAEKLGIKMEVKDENPYKSHEDLHNDILNNKHLSVWSGGAPPADHPLSEIDPKTGLSYNDKFRMVHDIFGHAAHKTDFSPSGEESAWNFHNQMFSPEARPALATETRGQAAYTYKYGDFPPQKAAILAPEAQGKDGFSFNPKTGQSPTSGYMVESHPELREVLDHPVTAEDIKNFADKNKDILDKHPELHIGGFKNELNISANVQDKAGALRLAKNLDQQSIYDVKNAATIDSKGTGVRKEFPNYTSDERMADLKGETEMGPEGWEHLPAKIHDSMEPDEREFVKGNKTRQKNVVDAYRAIKPSLEETTNSMNAGAMNGGWWQRFMDTFGIVGGADKDTGVPHAEALKQWHSALSGNKNVADAANLAGHSYADWLDAGKPTDRKSINDIIKKNGAQPAGATKKGNAAMSDTIKNGVTTNEGVDTTKILNLVNSPEMRGEKPFTGEAFGGTNPLRGVSPGAIKIPSMGATVAGKGNLNRLVLDAHGLDFYQMNGWNDASYIAHSVHMRHAAEALGLKGGEGQEQQWGVILGLKELLKEGLSPEDAAKGVTDDLILQKGKDYAKIIKDDPESNAIFERLKKYGTKNPSEIQSGLDKILSGRPVPREETGVNQTLLANTAKRIRETIDPKKIKKTDTVATEGLGPSHAAAPKSKADILHERMARKAEMNRQLAEGTKGLS